MAFSFLLSLAAAPPSPAWRRRRRPDPDHLEGVLLAIRLGQRDVFAGLERMARQLEERLVVLVARPIRKREMLVIARAHDLAVLVLAVPELVDGAELRQLLEMRAANMAVRLERCEELIAVLVRAFRE